MFPAQNSLLKLTLNLLLIVGSLILCFTQPLLAQQSPHNEQKGYVADGYDVVAYFTEGAVPGIDSFTCVYDSANYRFSTAENLKHFQATPNQYVPQYGGWCAYGMGANGKQYAINPRTYEIREGKLYLFYHTFYYNALKQWTQQGPEQLKKQADGNWERLYLKLD